MRVRHTPILTGMLFSAITSTCALLGAVELDKPLEALRSVGPFGQGNRAAEQAWRELSKADAKELPEILAALDGASPLAANWIRSAVDTIAGRALQAGQLQAAPLEKFALDRQHTPRARRLAFEWLAKVEALRGILTSGGRTLAQGALAWLWARSAQTLPIPGFRTVAQVEDNCGALKFGPLTQEQMREIEIILRREE